MISSAQETGTWQTLWSLVSGAVTFAAWAFAIGFAVLFAASVVMTTRDRWNRERTRWRTKWIAEQTHRAHVERRILTDAVTDYAAAAHGTRTLSQRAEVVSEGVDAEGDLRLITLVKYSMSAARFMELSRDVGDRLNSADQRRAELGEVKPDE